MKKKLVIVATLTVAVAGCFVAKLFAQAGGAAGTGQVKMAVINVDAIFGKYEKAKTYKGELDTMIAPYKGEAEKLKKHIMDVQEYLKHPKATDKEKWDKAILDDRRKLEDLDREVRKLIGKKQEDQLVVLYKDIVSTTERYAQSNGISLVFGYGEPFEGTDKDLMSFPNISRKMQGMGMGVVPIWYHGSLDITDAVIQTLNANYKNAPATPTSGSGK